MKGQSCEFDDGKPYQVHAAEFMVARRDSDGKFKGPMWFCQKHFMDYATSTIIFVYDEVGPGWLEARKDGDAESGKGDAETK